MIEESHLEEDDKKEELDRLKDKIDLRRLC